MFEGERHAQMRYEIGPKQVATLASILHENWRAPRKKEDGSFEPRPKKTKDALWLARNGINGDAGEVDIANTAYDDLPNEWQNENKLAAEAALVIVNEAIVAEKDVTKPETIEQLAAEVHVKWLERNGEYAPDSQKLPYPELSEKDKEEDRKPVRAAIDILKKMR